MERVQRGDREAYGALLVDVSAPLLHFLRRRIRDPHELEDVYQDTLVAVHRARHTYDPSRPFDPWLFAIARHVVIDHLRRRATQASRELLVDDVPDVPADAAAADPAQPRLAEALGRLPAAQREAFEMLKLDGLSVAAAAARAGVTTGALKVRAHRAYKALRALLHG